MKTVAVIAEFNPLHKGHEYHIKKSKEMLNADNVIILMSGNFMQRGFPAMANKYFRAKCALECGGDVVLNLPLFFATGSAEYFATGAVKILDSLGVVDYLSFGSECGDIDVLNEVADKLLFETDEYKICLQELLKEGLPYALARSETFKKLYPDLAPVLLTPNNILAIEYIKALKRINSKIIPVTIKRFTSEKDENMKAYNIHLFDSDKALDTLTFNYNGKDEFISASTIRRYFETNDLISAFDSVPESTVRYYKEEINKSLPVTLEDFAMPLYSRLFNKDASSLTQYLDVNDALANRMIRMLPKFTSYEDFCNIIKTKGYSMTRIFRALLHILLSVPSDIEAYFEKDALFTEIIGFRTDSTELLRAIQDTSDIPVLTKSAHAKKKLSENAHAHFMADKCASALYYQVCRQKFKTELIDEFKKDPIQV